MPLRGLINEKDVIASFLSANEWAELRTAVRNHRIEVLLPCCQNTAHLRTSKLGTNHFVHNRKNNCSWGPETIEHLKAKMDIAIACRAAGYEVSTEALGPDWRADVLAIKGSVKVAFEIQWSRLTLEETEKRQHQYRRDGIRCCWFFRSPPKEWNTAVKHLPLFTLQPNPNEGSLALRVRLQHKTIPFDSQPSYPLYYFVTFLLNRQIKFCSHYKTRRQQSLRITFMDLECLRCKKISRIYFVGRHLISSCGKRMFENADDDWNSEAALFDAVLKLTKSMENVNVKLGRIKSQYSKATGKKYTSFGCYYCGTLFNHDFIRKEALKGSNSVGPVPAAFEGMIVLPEPLPTDSGAHWCFSENQVFCE